MRVRGISWVGVKTDSYQQMRDFFADTVGVAAEYERPDFAVFRFPNGDKLEVFGPGADDPAEQFAVEKVVASLLVDDIDAAVTELRQAGIELIGTKQGGGDGYFWQHFRAPDGKVFELVCDPRHP
ncbi:VOC family protein [Actinoplanes sp. GCM10030250]|uniref:VOC family protein n=1 Tax=Actinoplanes sp. GCM10030250 TaxID=3273376 RepID=UPI0036163AED